MSPDRNAFDKFLEYTPRMNDKVLSQNRRSWGVIVRRMRFTFFPLIFLSILSVVVVSKAAEPLPASHVTWQEHFGSSTTDKKLFTLMAHGYFRAKSTNVQSVVDTWLKNHPKAVVISVWMGGPITNQLSSPRLSYAWVVQGVDSLNVDLVRHGCFAPETQLLKRDEKLEVSQKDYEAFVQRVSKAEESAKAEKIGIWRETH